MKVFLSAAAVLSTLAVAPAAFAGIITIVPTAPAGTFSSNPVVCTGTPCTFSDSGTFAAPVGYNMVGATVTTGPSAVHSNNDLDFLTGFLNGTPFSFSVPAGAVDQGYTILMPLLPTNTLSFTGLGYGENPSGSYSGTLTFFNDTGVPEPGTWMMMLLGFLGVGLMLRKGRKVQAGGRMRFSSPVLPQLA